MSAFHKACNAFGLTVSIPKTEVMAMSRTIVAIDGRELTQPDWFKYLGAKSAPDGKSALEVTRRVGLASEVFFRYLHWFKSRQFSYQHKIYLYYTYVLTVLLYGCETWTTTAPILKRLESFNYISHLFICGNFKRDQVSYASMLKQSTMNVTIEGLVRQRRLNWVGRIEAMPWSRLPKKVLYSTLRVKDKIIGSPSSFKGCVKDDLIKFGLAKDLNGNEDFEYWRTKTESFDEWKKLVAENRTSIFMREFYSKEEKLHNKRACNKKKQ
jgi:hypothetical protein